MQHHTSHEKRLGPAGLVVQGQQASTGLLLRLEVLHSQALVRG